MLREMHRAIEGLPTSEFRRSAVLLLLELPHSGIRPLPVVAGTIGDRGEQTACLGVEQVAIVHLGVHHIEEIPVHAELQLPLRAVSHDDGADITPTRDIRV